MDSLSQANVGDVYNFDYMQPLHGQTKRMLARVVAVKKLTRERILQLHAESNYRRYEDQFERTETVLTCQMPNGNYRNFYAERAENCVRSNLVKFLFWSGVARLNFRA